MNRILLLCFMLFAVASSAWASFSPEDQDTSADSLQLEADSLGSCSLAAIAFSNAQFRTQGAAQNHCQTLLSQVRNNAQATCQVLRKGNQFQVRFRLNLNIANQILNVLLQGLQNFILQNNVLASNLLAIQFAVSNGCG